MKKSTRDEIIQKDIEDLKRLGYGQQLFRKMGGFSNFAISFSIISILTGAILLLKKTHAGYYFLSVLYANMIVAELAHFVFPFMEDGTFHYVSGMYTAALPLLPAIYGLYITLREIRKTRSRPPLQAAPATR